MSLPSPHSDLSLTALRYLAGELDGSDLTAFEQRLATDDAAQRALIEAVQLSAAIQGTARTPVANSVMGATGSASAIQQSASNGNALAKPVAPAATFAPMIRPVAMRPPQRKSRWSGAAALVCSALVVATVLIALRGEPESETPVASAEETSSGATVSLWTELNVDDIAASLDESSLYESDGELAEGVNVPDWMFAAIETDFESSNPATDPSAEAPL
jgi:hypothetical protein